MKTTNIKKFLYFYIIPLFAGLLLLKNAYAWNHEISLGYGLAQEIGYDYYNSGFLLNAKLYKFGYIDKTLLFTVDGSLGKWHATTDEHKNLMTAAVSVAFRAYFIPPENRKFNPYLSASFGPTFLSHNQFGEREQSAHFSFQTTLGFGTEIMQDQTHGFDVSLQLAHYCNAGIFAVNRGINILYLVSIGYMF